MVWATEEDLGIDVGLHGAAPEDPPLPDNYYGAPAEQPKTPTGNGTGYFVDPYSNPLLGTLDKALNWALQRDQIRFAQEHGVQTVGGAVVPTQAQAARMQNQQLMLFVGIGVIAYLIAKA